MRSNVAVSDVRRDTATGIVSRAGRRVGLATLLIVIGCGSLQTASAVGDTRTLSFHHTHTGETLTVTYKRDGRYDPDAMKKIDWVMRDWRRNQSVRMDPLVIDAVWELTRAVGGGEVDIICGYRAPETNSMLRRRSGGVAQFSQHMLGKAIDLKIRNVPLDKQREAALRLHRGGVGYYPGSQFIHVDVASVRHWPKMSYDQLARVFPDGRTVHVPSNGKPLPGYQLALADIQKRGSSSAFAGLDTAAPAKSGRNLLTALFGGTKDPEEDEDAARTTPAAGAKPNPTKPDTARAGRTRVAQADTARTDATRVDVKLDLARADTTRTDVRKAEVAKTEPAKPVIAKPETVRVAVATPSRAAAVAPVAASAAPAPEPEMFQLASSTSTAVELIGEPPRPPASIGTAPGQIAAGDQPYRTASAGDVIVPTGRDRTPSETGSLWSRQRGDTADRVPLELALAYASEPDRRAAPAPVARTPAMGSLVDRARLTAEPPTVAPTTAVPAAADADPLTVVKKTAARVPVGGRQPAPAPAPVERPVAAAPAPAPQTAAVRPVAPGTRFDDPWLRAVMLAPSLTTALTVTPSGDPDYTELRSLMGKPVGSVVMAFAPEPYPGLANDRFSGGAVVFLATVTFRRTAALR